MNFILTNGSRKLFLRNTIAYLIVALMTPFLTRLYNPEQFGTLSLMIFVSSFLAILITARLELAIPLIKKVRPLNSLIKVLFLSALIFCIVFGLFIFFFQDNILQLFFDADKYGNWILIVPFYGAALCTNSILILFLTREKKFEAIGLSLVFQNFAFGLLAVALSAFNADFNGLIVGKFFGLVTSILFILIIIKYKLKELLFLKLEFIHLKKETRTLKQFAQFNLPVSLMEIVGRDLIILIFAFSQGVVYAGFYVMARVIGELPTSMVSSALGTVFYSETAASSDGLTLRDEILKEIKLIIKFLLTLVIPVYLILAIWSVEIFKFLFGQNWEMSGFMFLILLPVSIISLLSCWLIRLFEVLGKQKLTFRIQFTFDVTALLVALVLFHYEVNVEIILASIVVCYSLVQILITLYSFKMLAFNAKTIRFVACFLVLFSLSNAVIMTNFFGNFDQKIQAIWLIISSSSFFLLGHTLFRSYRLKDLNVFS